MSKYYVANLDVDDPQVVDAEQVRDANFAACAALSPSFTDTRKGPQFFDVDQLKVIPIERGAWLVSSRPGETHRVSDRIFRATYRECP